MSINVNEPWHTDESDPLGDIANVADVIKKSDYDIPVFFVGKNIAIGRPETSIDWDKINETLAIQYNINKMCNEYINVGTPGHCDHRGKSVMQTVVDNIREAELALLNFGESLQRVDFPFEALPLTSLDRRYMIVAPDRMSANSIGRYMLNPKPRVNKPYYRQFEKRSKKQ